MTRPANKLRASLLDYFLNGWEHAPDHAAAVADLVGLNRLPLACVEELVTRWEKERPDLRRPEDKRNALFAQQEAAERLVDEVLADRGIAAPADCRFECGKPATITGQHPLFGRVHACRRCARQWNVTPEVARAW